MVAVRVSVALAAVLFAAAPCQAIRSRHRTKVGVVPADQTFHTRVELGSEGGCQVLQASWGQVHRLALESVFQKGPEWEWEDEEDGSHSETQFVDLWGPTEALVQARAVEVCGGEPKKAEPVVMMASQDTEVQCIICSGNSSNRIDVVFMGDGYTMEERGRFFEDMRRLTKDMFEDITFSSFLPVFNIWAIHVPAVESGIGYYGRNKNTPFQLYKVGTQHRGVLPTWSGRRMAREVCKLAGGCDYPSIIGNDEFYGGLGGEFVIGTRSKTTGTVVLRHEMGHNFVSVGEEYDGGSVYRGVNAEVPSSLSDLKWKHWLTEPNKPVVEQRMNLAVKAYPWADLAEGPQSFSFESPGTYSSWKWVFTVSGCPEEGSLKIFLDGQQLAWTPTTPLGAERADGHTVDRQFYYYGNATEGLSKGRHTLTFESGFAPPPGAPIRQLCSLNLHEFGGPGEFEWTPGYIGAYPTWDRNNRKSYRPTNDQCLMRMMESKDFCPICKEGMWQQFFQRMTLIDDVKVSRSGGETKVELEAVPLAHLRKKPLPGITESYEVVWWKNGQQQNDLAGSWAFNGSSADLAGDWKVSLTYHTSEVRSDPSNLLSAERRFSL